MTTTHSKMISYLPTYERKNALINEVVKSSAIELEKLDAKINEKQNELFLDTASSKAIALHERDLNLVTDKTVPIERRRAIVQARYKAVLQQTTEETLKSVGESFSTAKVDIEKGDVVGSYDIIFYGENGLPDDTESVIKAIDDAIPAHLDFKIQYIMGRFSDIKAGMYHQSGEIIVIYPPSVEGIEQNSDLYVSLCTFSGDTTVIYPKRS